MHVFTCDMSVYVCITHGDQSLCMHSSLHLPVTPAQLMRHGNGRNMSCAVHLYRPAIFIDISSHTCVLLAEYEALMCCDTSDNVVCMRGYDIVYHCACVSAGSDPRTAAPAGSGPAEDGHDHPAPGGWGTNKKRGGRT